jgi:hypothetical protein
MKCGFQPEAILLGRAATFLQHLFIGWNRYNVQYRDKRVVEPKRHDGMERVHNSLLSAVFHDKPQQESMSKQDGPRRVGLKKTCGVEQI